MLHAAGLQNVLISNGRTKNLEVTDDKKLALSFNGLVSNDYDTCGDETVRRMVVEGNIGDSMTFSEYNINHRGDSSFDDNGIIDSFKCIETYIKDQESFDNALISL